MGRIKQLGIVMLVVAVLVGGLPPVAGAQSSAEAPVAPSAGAHVAAVFSNVIYIPGKVVTCAVGGVLGVAVMVGTLGASTDAGAVAMKAACGGKWVVSGQDIHDAIHPESASKQ